MNREQAQADLQAAMNDYRTARHSLDHHRGLAKHGIANALAHAVAAEHSAFYRLERAQAAYAAHQPTPVATAPAPKAVATPATFTPSIGAKTVPPKPTASNTGSFDLLGHLNDQCELSETRWMARYGLQPRRNS